MDGLEESDLAERLNSVDAAIKTLGNTFTVYSDGSNIDRGCRPCPFQPSLSIRAPVMLFGVQLPVAFVSASTLSPLLMPFSCWGSCSWIFTVKMLN